MDLQMPILMEKILEGLSEHAVTLSNDFNEILAPILSENIKLKDEIENLKSRVRVLEREVKKNNFIIHGIPEEELTYFELLEDVLKILNEVSDNAKIEKWDKLDISHLRRVGTKNESKIRPVVVTTVRTWRKIEILKNYSKFPENLNVSDDYPKEVLNKRRELKVIQEAEIKNGKLAYIKYDKLIVKDMPTKGTAENVTDQLL